MEVESSKQEENKTMMAQHDHNPDKKRRRKIICLVVISVILALALIFLILGLTVFKAKRPVITVNSVALSDLDFSFDVARLRVLLNVSVDTSIAVKNPNRVGFKYKNSTALLKYRGDVVGEVPVPAGKIGARDSMIMNLTLTLMADRVLSNSNLYSDIRSGIFDDFHYIATLCCLVLC
ncbi:Late embryogenesis abundant, LEA-14 [Olea europaea subsp. europaea]|uniref:Late embryogenesis abundant, LEA-14 n=1 Tax=Olea europaea subsp. europaea TaxID=158383 RepID=A0A8S0TEZ8_OLEEU|nr:Late embryogenesis abundant, LEA-14 [Olea europaea subsp. europaea]